jgi:hypothetical protein
MESDSAAPTGRIDDLSWVSTWLADAAAVGANRPLAATSETPHGPTVCPAPGRTSGSITDGDPYWTLCGAGVHKVPIGGEAFGIALGIISMMRARRSSFSCFWPLHMIVGMSLTSNGNSVPFMAVTTTFLPSPSA